jgi:glycosyltransferase involved in cell wall biosynthesis
VGVAPQEEEVLADTDRFRAAIARRACVLFHNGSRTFHLHAVLTWKPHPRTDSFRAMGRRTIVEGPTGRFGNGGIDDMSDYVVSKVAANSRQVSVAGQQVGPRARSSTTAPSMYPLVTLAVTTLNRADYLRETLLSVLAQDYPNLEILVSDNGSRDETPTLVQALIKDDTRARLRRNETSVPQHEHFTQCVQAARGEFLILLCDDDLINPSFVSELVRVATRHTDVNVVVPANATIDERGKVIKAFAKPQGEVFDGPEFVLRWLRGVGPQLFANLATVLGRTEVIRHFGGYHSFARGQNMENLLFLQCAISGLVGFAPDAVFNWRVHNRSYGSHATPEQIAESSRQFLHHLRADPCTVNALSALPAARRKQIINGVRYMNAVSLVYQMILFRKSVLAEIFSNHIPTYGWDRMLCFVAFRSYYRALKGLVKNLVFGAR